MATGGRRTGTPSSSFNLKACGKSRILNAFVTEGCSVRGVSEVESFLAVLLQNAVLAEALKLAHISRVIKSLSRALKREGEAH